MASERVNELNEWSEPTWVWVSFYKATFQNDKCKLSTKFLGESTNFLASLQPVTSQELNLKDFRLWPFSLHMYNLNSGSTCVCPQETLTKRGQLQGLSALLSAFLTAESHNVSREPNNWSWGSHSAAQDAFIFVLHRTAPFWRWNAASSSVDRGLHTSAAHGNDKQHCF